MAIATYSDLKTSVANFIHRSDLTSSIPDFIALAETRINGDLDARQQDTSYVMTTVAGQNYLDCPSDLISVRRFAINDTNPDPLNYVAPENFTLESNTATSGSPRKYTIVGSKFYFDPVPDAAYTANLIYKARLSPLSDSNTTNFLLTNFPRVYLYATLSVASSFTRDLDALQLYESKYQESIKAVNDQDWYSGGSMRVKQDVRI